MAGSEQPSLKNGGLADGPAWRIATDRNGVTQPSFDRSGQGDDFDSAASVRISDNQTQFRCMENELGNPVLAPSCPT